MHDNADLRRRKPDRPVRPLRISSPGSIRPAAAMSSTPKKNTTAKSSQNHANCVTKRQFVFRITAAFLNRP